MIVVVDTSPPLHLGRIGRLALLPDVLGRVVMPRTVWEELVQAGTSPKIVATVETADWIDVVDDQGGASTAEPSRFKSCATTSPWIQARASRA